MLFIVLYRLPLTSVITHCVYPPKFGMIYEIFHWQINFYFSFVLKTFLDLPAIFSYKRQAGSAHLLKNSFHVKLKKEILLCQSERSKILQPEIFIFICAFIERSFRELSEFRGVIFSSKFP